MNRLDLYNPGTAKRFIYDGDEVAAELDSSGNIIARYVRGDAPDEILVGYTSADPTARGWYHLDERNSVVAITDPNGVATVVNRYDEYGQPQGGNYGTFQYTGQMWLGEIGVYDYKNRMYWPNERPGGRFLQTDPVGPVDSANLYQYALNDPVNNVDRTGLKADDPWAVLPISPDCWVSICVTGIGANSPSMGATLLLGAINGAASVPGGNESGGGAGKDDRQCKGPPVPGSADDRRWYSRISRHDAQVARWLPPYGFYNKVRNGGPWDFKQYDSNLQDFGNYHYGYVGAAAGYPLEVLDRMAGWAQRRAGTSRQDWGNPLGRAPYGDDPQDQQLIRQGFEDWKNGC